MSEHSAECSSTILTRVFRYGGISRRDLDHDIDSLADVHHRWQASERYVGTRMPATQYISVGGSQICLLQQNRNPLPTLTIIIKRL